MLDLKDNIYNRSVARTEPKFKLWTWAGLMLTYRCSAACRFCYYCCSPQTPSPVMSVEMAIGAYNSLKNLAGDTARIHITGGEPFLEWPRLAEIATAIKKEKLGPIDEVETNASWATDPKTISDRIHLLDQAGMKTLKISADPFHQEYVKIDNVRLLAQFAGEILGTDRVKVRWQEYVENPLLTAQIPPVKRDQLHLESISRFKARFTGRAAFELGLLAPQKSIYDISGQNCSNQFLGAKGVHIDPMGNVFSGLCSGIIIGNINQTPLDQLWKQIDWRNIGVVDILFKSGPAGMLGFAEKAGFKVSRYYSGNCHLCTGIRDFFYKTGNYTSILGPAQCYTGSSGNADARY